tara:strand:- start:1424 stop:1972 length:549 start_codon:yes stop_codon:yes gene_type:complete
MDIDLDLAFVGIENQDILNLDLEFKQYPLLNDHKYWFEELIIWLKYIREDINLHCPSLVRKRTSLSMGLQFTDDLTIRELNHRWRKKDQHTDVLSFPVVDENSSAPQGLPIELGDIVVSIPMAQRQAIDHNHSLEMELRWLVSHGLLHLLGWDHPDSNRLREMLSLQEQVLQISGNLPTVRI